MNVGYVYKISSPSTSKIYIGSTINSINNRFSDHKHLRTCSSSEIMKYGDAMIELIESVEFENKKDLRYRERHHIELNRELCVNKINPIISAEEIRVRKLKENKKWRDENKEKRKIYMKKYNTKYYEDNKEDIMIHSKKYYDENKEIILQREKEKYYQKKCEHTSS